MFSIYSKSEHVEICLSLTTYHRVLTAFRSQAMSLLSAINREQENIHGLQQLNDNLDTSRFIWFVVSCAKRLRKLLMLCLREFAS